MKDKSKVLKVQDINKFITKLNTPRTNNGFITKYLSRSRKVIRSPKVEASFQPINTEKDTVAVNCYGKHKRKILNLCNTVNELCYRNAHIKEKLRRGGPILFQVYIENINHSLHENSAAIIKTEKLDSYRSKSRQQNTHRWYDLRPRLEINKSLKNYSKYGHLEKLCNFVNINNSPSNQCKFDYTDQSTELNKKTKGIVANAIQENKLSQIGRAHV